MAEAGLDGVDFPGPLFIAVPPVEMDWDTRLQLTRETPDPASGDLDALIAVAWDRAEAYDPFLFGTVAQNLAEQFATRGSPISLSTACASGATAITLAVEAIQRGEAETALAIGSDGSVTPESLIRFSLLSALTARNDPPEAAARPFAKGATGS